MKELNIKEKQEWPRDFDLDFIDPHGDVDDRRQLDKTEGEGGES